MGHSFPSRSLFLSKSPARKISPRAERRRRIETNEGDGTFPVKIQNFQNEWGELPERDGPVVVSVVVPSSLLTLSVHDSLAPISYSFACFLGFLLHFHVILAKIVTFQVTLVKHLLKSLYSTSREQTDYQGRINEIWNV